jgi:hypothetical protein
MNVSLTHKKDMAMDWNILASAKADKGEQISRAQILVNGMSKYDQSFSSPLSEWQHELARQGQYPGDNTSRLQITSDTGDVTSTEDSWSGIE